MAVKQINPNLSEEQKRILLEADTEMPFSGELLHNKTVGDYQCMNCGAVVFDSETKFDSDSGWPSFYDPKNTKAVRLVEDLSQGMHRVEVRCAKCDAHLGHIFNDAIDQPTGTRFCINSCALDFKPKGNK